MGIGRGGGEEDKKETFMTKKILVTAPYFSSVMKDYQKRAAKDNVRLVPFFAKQRWGEKILMKKIHLYDGVICGDDVYSEKVIAKGAAGKLGRAVLAPGCHVDGPPGPEVP